MREHAAALNEVVVNRGALGTMIECAVEIDGRFVYAMRADGIIVATPTGSTAYALSAGGPILAPEVPAFALVPVAPHALTHRPIAVPDSAAIAIAVNRGRDASVHCDGQAHFELAEGDRVRRCAAPTTARASCTRKATTISRCCAKSSTGSGNARTHSRPSLNGPERLPRPPLLTRPMLRLLSIRNFVVVESLDVEFAAGFSVLTGETGAGKSILLDALSLLLGDRFELRQLRPGAERAELAAEFDVSDAPGVTAWLSEQGIAADDGDVLLRRVFDAQGKSRAWINGSAATLAQLKSLGERLVDLHGQHAHQALAAADAQRALLDAFGGFTTLTREVAAAWREWRAAAALRAAAASAAAASSAERELLAARARELRGPRRHRHGVDRSRECPIAPRQRGHAARSRGVEADDALAEGDGALTVRLSHVVARLDAAAAHDPALKDIAGLLEPAAIQLDEAARALREYRRRLDVDPGELARVEARLSAVHDMARKHRVRPEALPELLAETEARLAALDEAADAGALAERAAAAEARYRAFAEPLSSKRRFAANELAHRVTTAMQELAMSGGRLDVALVPEAEPASHGLEHVELRVASHPKQPLGPLARVASGGELSRIALAIQVVTSEVGHVPTLVFDEVDTGIGGAVAATVGKSLQALGHTRRGALRHAPRAGGGARRRALSRGEDRPQGQRRHHARPAGRHPSVSTSSRACSQAARSPPRRARTRRSSTTCTAASRRPSGPTPSTVVGVAFVRAVAGDRGRRAGAGTAESAPRRAENPSIPAWDPPSR